MARHTVHKAQREAEAAADAANQTRMQLEEQTRIEKERSEREKLKAQRILSRSLRAGAGGYFESDSDNLGGSGALG